MTTRPVRGFRTGRVVTFPRRPADDDVYVRSGDSAWLVKGSYTCYLRSA
ncbi:hypothetical protein [Streptomyces sp. NPDC057287]